MGLIHSRASKKRDRALAALTSDQAGIVRDERLAHHRAAAAGHPWWRQRTVRDMFRVLLGGS